MAEILVYETKGSTYATDGGTQPRAPVPTPTSLHRTGKCRSMNTRCTDISALSHWVAPQGRLATKPPLTEDLTVVDRRSRCDSNGSLVGQPVYNDPMCRSAERGNQSQIEEG